VKKLGRPPTRTPENLPEGWYDLLYAAAEQGASKTEMASLLKLPKRTFDKMRENYPEFAEQCEQLSHVAQVWWERTGRKLVTGEISGSASAFIFQVKNRFPEDYRDKQEIDHGVTKHNPVSKVTIEVIDAAQDKSDETAS
jgi:hypothetical protein